MKISDQYICELLSSNDKRGMTLLFKKYFKSLTIWADNFLNDMDQSKDIVQDFFYAIWIKKTYQKLHHETLKSYLFVSVKNLSLKKLTKKDALRNSLDVEYLDHIKDDFESNKEEVIKAILQEIDNLPERSREVVKCVYLKGMKYQEAADELGVSVSTIKTLLVRSMRSLRLSFKHLTDFYFFLFLREIMY